MAKHPWMPFYVADWLTGTVLLSPAEKGVYIDLMAYQWDNGAVPGDDLRALARIARCDLAEIQQAWPAVSVKFTRGEDGLWRNQRVEDERSVGQRLGERNQRGGQARAAQAGRVAGKFAPAYDQPEHQPNHQPNGQPSHQPPPANSQSQSQSQIQRTEQREAKPLAPVVVMPQQPPRYMRGVGGKHGDCLTGCATGMCLHEEQAMELAARLPGGFTEQGLEDTVKWAEAVVAERVAKRQGMPDRNVWDFWKNRWAEQFGGSAPSFQQLRGRRTQDALRAAFNE